MVKPAFISIGTPPWKVNLVAAGVDEARLRVEEKAGSLMAAITAQLTMPAYCARLRAVSGAITREHAKHAAL